MKNISKRKGEELGRWPKIMTNSLFPRFFHPPPQLSSFVLNYLLFSHPHTLHLLYPVQISSFSNPKRAETLPASYNSYLWVKLTQIKWSCHCEQWLRFESSDPNLLCVCPLHHPLPQVALQSFTIHIFIFGKILLISTRNKNIPLYSTLPLTHTHSWLIQCCEVGQHIPQEALGFLEHVQRTF